MVKSVGVALLVGLLSSLPPSTTAAAAVPTSTPAAAPAPAPAPSGGSAATSRRASTARELDRQTATLTRSVAGMPTTTDTGRQLRRAEVEVVHRRSAPGIHLNARTWLRAAPSGNPDSLLRLGAGWLNGSECQVQTYQDATVWAADGTGVRAVGEVVDRPSRLWTCVVVLVLDRDDTSVVHDAMVGPLTDVYVQPRLGIAEVEVIGTKQKRLRLVRRAAQLHDVAIANTGHLRATGVVVTGKGKGVKVKRTVVGAVEARSTAWARVPITLTGAKKRTKVRLVVRGAGTPKATRVLPVRRIAPPPRPLSGRWKSGSTFSFRVHKGRIVGFRGVNLRMRCTSPLGHPTYRNVSLTFPRTKIPRHGIVDAVRQRRKGDVWYRVSLEGKLTRTKLVKGAFGYVTGSCSVREGFTAKPTRR